MLRVSQSYDVLEARDKDGVVRHIIRNINREGHAREVLNLTRELNGY